MIAFRRLYRRVEKSGRINDSIIKLEVKPYAYSHSSSGHNYTQYVKRLWIDLWLVVLHFEWLTKDIEDEE